MIRKLSTFLISNFIKLYVRFWSLDWIIRHVYQLHSLTLIYYNPLRNGINTTVSHAIQNYSIHPHNA